MLDYEEWLFLSWGKGEEGVLTNPTLQVSIREDNSLSDQNQHVFTSVARLEWNNKHLHTKATPRTSDCLPQRQQSNNRATNPALHPPV